MKITKFLFVSLLILAACRGYKGTSAPPRTPEDLQLAEAAAKLAEVSEALQERSPEPLKSEMN
ncbi:MAG TPA: hypothetical protein VI958_04320, partial [Acidobacteriota bacterium]